MSAPTDCSICLLAIDAQCNNTTVTNCGHCFHASCLMRHVAMNGFNCPYCRTNMVNIPESEPEPEPEPIIMKKLIVNGKKYLLNTANNYLYDWQVYVEEGEADRVGKWDPDRKRIVATDL